MPAGLASWLRAQLADDEAAEHRKWKRTLDPGGRPSLCPRCGWLVEEVEMTFHEPGATMLPCRHELTWDEWRVFADLQPAPDQFRLAEIAATRAILDQYAAALQAKNWPACTALEDVLPVLVQPYRDRPGFDPSWVAE